MNAEFARLYRSKSTRNLNSMILPGRAGASMIGVLPVLAIAASAMAGGKALGPAPVPQAHMGAPLQGLTADQLARFELGRQRFIASLGISQGLGPIFNKSSCGNCHNNPTGGPGTQTVTRFGRDEKGVFDPLDALGGSLLQSSAIGPDCGEIVPPEANVTQLRVTNGALAYGLVEAIPDAALLANRDAQPVAVRGVAHMVSAFEDPAGSPLHVGRFGWKAQVATVLTFSADAALNEMGLTNRFVQQENAPNGDLTRLAECDTVADPEDNISLGNGSNREFIDVVTDFQRFLAPFPQTPKSGMSGEVVFNNIGCAVCHTPTFTTSNNPSLESAIRNKVIHPYSDFLLHDMGLQGDPIVQGDAIQGYVKTPPLWGIAVRDPMWHNGEIGGGLFEDRINQAIARHGAFGSQGKPSADAYAALSPADQAKLIAFLASLGQAEFDFDLDNAVTLLDFQAFRGCFTGPGSFYTPDSPCSIHDIDQDGDVDLADFDAFMLVYQGTRRDCNGNGILDLREILLGSVADANNNGIPDSCEPTCDADLNGSGNVNVSDLLGVINQWGACPAPTLPCSADIDANGIVDVTDLLSIINFWGPCP